MDSTNAETIQDLAFAQGADVQDVLDGHGIVVPPGYTHLDLEELQDTPRRIRESIDAHTLDGFLDYFENYAGIYTAVFAHPIDGNVCAIFDYHGGAESGGGAQWCDHKASFEPAKSRELRAWQKDDENMMMQEDFANFVEERAEDFASPDSADMLTIARNFQAKRDVDFQSAKAADSGDIQFTYEEETTVTGEIQVPNEFAIQIPVFRGGILFTFRARFTYRLSGQTLRLGYKLIRPHKVIEEAASVIIEQVEEAADELDVPVYYADQS